MSALLVEDFIARVLLSFVNLANSLPPACNWISLSPVSSITSLPGAFIFKEFPATFSIRFVNTEVSALTWPNEPVEVDEPLKWLPVTGEAKVTELFWTVIWAPLLFPIATVVWEVPIAKS